MAQGGSCKNPDDSGPGGRGAHFINVFMLDRDGNRINRRNPQDIFTPLYNKQIPGAAAVVHYRLDVPADVKAPIDLTARVRYRKFDYEYMALVHKDKPVPKLPIVDLCEDHVQLPVEGAAQPVPEQTAPIHRPGNAGTTMASAVCSRGASRPSTASWFRPRRPSSIC